MYQDALVFAFEDAGIKGNDLVKEYYFKTTYKGREKQHPHKVDAPIKDQCERYYFDPDTQVIFAF